MEVSTPTEIVQGERNDDEVPEDTGTQTTISVSAILYVMESFKATAVPVGITMILSALASNFILTEASAKAAEKQVTASYSAFHIDENASSSTQVGLGFLNGIIIIGAITAMTFVVVILYKYKCICILKGYMTFAILFLLGYFGSQMFVGAIDRYDLWISYISFAIFIWNFTVVGVYSIFYGHGVPVYVGQGYLIAVSVILAWQLAHFSEVTAWILLVLLALYDLFAVLTPCGPLKALVKLMSQEGAAELPALMYEAQLPAGARRQSPPGQAQIQTRQSQHSQDQANSNATSEAHGTESDNTLTSGSTYLQPPTDSSEEEKKDDNVIEDNGTQGVQGASNTNSWEPTGNLREPARDVIASTASEEVIHGSDQDEIETISRPTGTIPMAIAKLYKLSLADGEAAASAMLESNNLTPVQLHSLVDVYYPQNGGRIERVPDAEPEPERADNAPRTSWFRRRRGQSREPQPNQPAKYNVIDRHGAFKRTIFVNDDGKVCRVLDDEERLELERQEERKMPSSIRLGLGDFIFYSVLVSKASLFSFTTFASCVLGILAGLLLTLVLLAIRGKALPALPISIFFGVVFYFPTRYVVLPWIESIFIDHMYV